MKRKAPVAVYTGEAPSFWEELCLGDRFCEHLRDVERNDKDASKPVPRHFNLPNHSTHDDLRPFPTPG